MTRIALLAALLALPLAAPSAVAPAAAGDYILAPSAGILLVEAPDGTLFTAAGGGIGCAAPGVPCSARVDLPAGIPDGVWTIRASPVKLPDAGVGLLGIACDFGFPPMCWPYLDPYVSVGVWDGAYITWKLGGWSAERSALCPVSVPATFTLDTVAKATTAACGPLP